MIYLTINESVSGVYISQVLDVVSMLRSSKGIRLRLLALVSARNYFNTRRTIQQHDHTAMVLPMIHRARNWRLNVPAVAAVARWQHHTAVLARGPLAANLAIMARNFSGIRAVCYDGRGARAAEIREYSPRHPLLESMPVLEKRAVLESQYRIAVSDQLVDYWAQEYGYSGDRHRVIPCSLSRGFEIDPTDRRAAIRAELGWTGSDTVLVYSGSVAGWQSLAGLTDRIRGWLHQYDTARVLFLSRDVPEIQTLVREFPARVRQVWVPHDRVPEYLASGDYGLLVREPTLTNRVAAPVKFAEYLACGLSVICSEHLGDYSRFVRMNGCGMVVDHDGALPGLLPVPPGQKTRNRELALAHFSKRSPRIRDAYAAVLDGLGRP